jgi:hypothetical protein
MRARWRRRWRLVWSADDFDEAVAQAIALAKEVHPATVSKAQADLQPEPEPPADAPECPVVDLFTRQRVL